MYFQSLHRNNAKYNIYEITRDHMDRLLINGLATGHENTEMEMCTSTPNNIHEIYHKHSYTYTCLHKGDSYKATNGVEKKEERGEGVGVHILKTEGDKIYHQWKILLEFYNIASAY